MNLLGLSLGRPRMRFVAQLTASECTVACLAMVLGHHGRPVGRSEIRAALTPGRDGASAQDLLDAARRFGLVGRGVRRDPADLRHLKPGSVLHWNTRHFVVLEHVGRDHCLVLDPAVGRRRIDRADLESSFGGLVLEFSVDPTAVRQTSGQSPGSPALAIVRDGVRRASVLLPMLLDALVSTALVIGTALLIRTLVERVVEERRVGTDLLIYTGGLVLSTIAVVAWREQRVARLGLELERRLGRSLLGSLLRASPDFYRHRSTAELGTRLGGVAAVGERVARATQAVATEVPLVLACVVVLFGWSRPLAIAGVLLSSVYVSTNVALRKRQALRRRQLEPTERGARRFEAQVVEQVAAIRAARTERAVEAIWRSRARDVAEKLGRAAHVDAWAAGVMEGLRAFIPLALLAVGAFEVVQGTLGLAAMLGANCLAGALLRPLYALANAVEAVGPIKATLERIDDVLVEPAPLAANEVVQRSGPEAIVLEGVTIDTGGSPRLERVSLEIPPVRHIALAGDPRSASLLAAVIAGLERPDVGRVLVGRDDPAEQCIACVVRPGLELFDGCIHDNIALTEANVPEERVAAAARIAGLHSTVASMPLGYQTAVIDGGRGLDDELRRRILLARAIFVNPRLLVLDGASAPLGAAAERSLVDAVLGSTAQTVLTISEHPTTLRRADFVVVLDGGRVVEARRPTSNLLLVPNRGPE